MFKKVLPLFAVILLSGCAERGYELTVNQNIQTVTAVKSVDIRQSSKSATKKDMDSMNAAVSKVQTKKKAKLTITKTSTPTKTSAPKKQNTISDKELAKNEIIKETEKLDKSNKEKVLQQEEKAKKIQAVQDKKEKEILNRKLAQEKSTRIRKDKEAKVALEQKLAKEKQLRLKNEQKEKAALKRKQEAQAQEKAKKEKLTKEKEEIQQAKEAQTLALQAEKKAQAEKLKLENIGTMRVTASLNFKQSTQTYQKFGTSEIHGHVVYLAQAGHEVTMQKTKIYLVPKNTKTDYWYNNYYLKDKEAPAFTDMTVQYINATHLNLEKNFAFYGLSKGTYYIIIESTHPTLAGKNRTVYIAKKINVDKYKKIMTVFSKKL